jgi:hypothetical protein
MRKVIAMVVMLGCGGKPSSPDPAKFAAMSDEDKCIATEPRASQCADELVVMDVRDLADSSGLDAETAKTLEGDLEKSRRSNSDQAKGLHRASCAASRTSAYMDAVFECWAVEPCKDFANCVSAARRRDDKAK